MAGMWLRPVRLQPGLIPTVKHSRAGVPAGLQPLCDTAGLPQGPVLGTDSSGTSRGGGKGKHHSYSWSTCQANQVTLNYRGLPWESFWDLTLPSPALVPSSAVHSNIKEWAPVLLALCRSGSLNFTSSPAHLGLSSFSLCLRREQCSLQREPKVCKVFHEAERAKFHFVILVLIWSLYTVLMLEDPEYLPYKKLLGEAKMMYYVNQNIWEEVPLQEKFWCISRKKWMAGWRTELLHDI